MTSRWFRDRHVPLPLGSSSVGPAPPVGIVAIPGMTPDTVTIEWTADPDPEVLEYEVVIGPPAGPFASPPGSPVAKPGHSLVIHSLAPSTNYGVKVRSVKADGHGPFSTVVLFTTGPDTNLTPVILWDTRSWDGTTGPGTGGLPNEGTAGAKFDLDVVQVVGTTSWTDTYATGDAAGWHASVGGTWADLGGVPCDDPFTLMVAVGNISRYYPQGYYYAAALWRTLVGSVQIGLIDNYASANSSDKLSQGNTTIFHGQTGNNIVSSNWSPAANDTQDANAIRNKLLVATFDSVNGGATFQRGDDVVAPSSSDPGAGNEWFNYQTYGNWPVAAGNCSKYTDIAGLANFFQMDGDRRLVGLLPTPGEPWNNIIGVAIFRGEPTADDLTYWENYFYNGYLAPTTPQAYTGGVLRADDTYVYHTMDPGQTLTPIAGLTLPPYIDVFLVGGGASATAAPSSAGGGGGDTHLELAWPAPVSAQTVTGGGPGSAGAAGGAISFHGLSAAGGSVGTTTTGGVSGSGNAGGTGVTNTGGGGGGDAAVGTNGAGTVGGSGGAGTMNNWRTGTNEDYGSGGPGGGTTGRTGGTPGGPGAGTAGSTPTSAATGRGGGGAGRIGASGAGGSGGRGRVIVRYVRQG